METFTVGNYIVGKRRIGRGSFSKIYKGHHKDTQMVVAVKKIEVDNIKQINSNIEREIDVMMKLRHPNIVRLYDVVYDYENCNIFLIIEYCARGDFNKFLNKRALKEKHAKRYMRQLAQGLRYLLRNNVLHRDLKPHNILLTENNELKLSDFGFARYFEHNKLIETLCGSPMYMAPEIMKYKEYTNKSDLWSVGVIMYEMLTGRTPYRSKTFYNLMKDIDRKKIIIPPNIELSKECKQLIHKLLIKEPCKRISWKGFFNHRWFIDKNRLIIENKLLDIDFDMTTSRRNNLLLTSSSETQTITITQSPCQHPTKNLTQPPIPPYKPLTHSSVNSSINSSLHSSAQSCELRFEDMIGNDSGDDTDDTDDTDDSNDNFKSFEYIPKSTLTTNLNQNRSLPISVPGSIPNSLPITHNCNSGYFSNSPIFNNLRDSSFVIVQTPPGDIIRSDTSHNNLLKNMRGYIKSSISLLKDSINYISGNNSV